MKKFELMYLPDSGEEAAVKSAIAKAKADQGKDFLHYHHYLPGMQDEIEISSLPGKHPQANSGGLMVSLSPSSMILGAGSLTSALGASGVEVLLPGIRCAMNALLRLEDPNLPAIELRNFTVVRTTAEFFFEVDTEADATHLLLSLAQHCKVVMDFTSPMPNKKWSRPKKMLTRVNWAANAAQLLEISLPFGKATVCIVGDGRRLPAEFLRSGDIDHYGARLSFTRRLICIEIDAEMALVTEGADPSFRLPLQFDKWMPQAMNRNPYEFLWDAFAWDIWLNLDLPSSEVNVDVIAAGLSEEQENVLEAYFVGATLKTHYTINENHERFLAFRRALIQKTHVDLLNPWRFFRWNSAAALRPILTFSGQLKGEETPLLAEFTLTGKSAAGAAQVLNAALQGNPGRGNWHKQATSERHDHH